ncbi:DUF4040 family protein [Corynebacterium sp. sy017]|uniref:DUF4040 family protein n=1 Tax=unclassified Corynebacterium TaxID=2624378 RepID=UPI0011854F1A|nr:DUF4040 family protein [Corynebacterium sp. SY003]MBP3089419.1 DUF4040 family protein [Corynebacterium sp. sy017]TSD90894.1 DUF4040 family protein [Corynebacterium sp. SY003]
MTLIYVLALAVFAVLISPAAVRMFDRKAGLPLAAIFLGAAALLFSKLGHILHEQPLSYTTQWIPDLLGSGVGINFTLKADALSVFFALLALCIGAVVFIYSASYLPKRSGNTSFYTIMSAFMAAILLLVLADDAFILFIAWELVSLASFMLIARSGGKGGELGSQRTLVLTFVGGLTLLIALAIAATQAHTTSISGIIHADFWGENPRLSAIIAILIALSAFSKSAQLPFHFWLPEAMAAATPVSAFLHAAAVVKAGVYLLMRFSAVFHSTPAWNYLLIVVGMATAIMAALFAIQKTDLKKLTAYSTVSHLGWIVATIGVGTPFALGAALVHTLAHALFKSSLFMLIGVVDHQTGTRKTTRLGSSWRRLPFTFSSVLIATASMAALPPTMGFISKEGMLEAFSEAPLGNAGVIALLVAAGLGALCTFTYCARIVCDGFIDGDRDMSEVKEAPLSLWMPAALPGVLSLPLAFAVSSLNEPISQAVAVVSENPHAHLGLWHGISMPLMISTVVTILGVVGIVVRKRIWAALDEKKLAPLSGNELLNRLISLLSYCGKGCAWLADTLSPTRHLGYMFALIIVFAASVTIPGLIRGGVDGFPLPARLGTDYPIDILVLVLILGTVFGLVRAKKRISAVVFTSGVGVAVTLQILVLGAPDVALTQFMVEALVIVIMMLVIRQQPDTFHPQHTRSKVTAAVIALGVGVATFLAVYVLVGRRERSELGMWYLEQAPKITNGDNVVNTILVEFRALDTMGELSVLGMAAIVIAAVVTSMPRYPFAKGTHPKPLKNAQRNAIPLRMLLRILTPLLLILSALVFWRGHSSPGGGFIAALIAGGALMFSYLAKDKDQHIFPIKLPVYLTGAGILIALGAGFIGLLGGSFLYAFHGHWLGQHWTTAMIFDVGVYLAVIGMLSMAINALGGYLRPGMEYQDLNFTRQDSPLGSPPKIERIGQEGEL